MTLTRNLPAVPRPVSSAKPLEDYRRSVVGTRTEILERCQSHPCKLEPVSLRQLGPDAGEDTVYEAVVVKIPPRQWETWQKAAIVTAATALPLGVLCWFVIALLGLLATLWPVLAVLGALVVLGGGGACTTIVRVTHFH